MDAESPGASRARDRSARLRELSNITHTTFDEDDLAAYDDVQLMRAEAVLEALAAVRTTFASRKLSDPMSGCPCCTSPEFYVNTPLDDLSEHNMFFVVSDLLNVMGTNDDVPYFVPRFCADLYAGATYDIELAFLKLRSARFTEWAAPEKDAVRQFLKAQWQYVLARDLESIPFGWKATFECIAILEETERALALLVSNHDIRTDRFLISLLAFTLEGLHDRNPLGYFGAFHDMGEAVAATKRWAISQPGANRLEAARARLQSTDLPAAQRLDRLRFALCVDDPSQA